MLSYYIRSESLSIGKMINNNDELEIVRNKNSQNNARSIISAINVH